VSKLAPYFADRDTRLNALGPKTRARLDEIRENAEDPEQATDQFFVSAFIAERTGKPHSQVLDNYEAERNAYFRRELKDSDAWAEAAQFYKQNNVPVGQQNDFIDAGRSLMGGSVETGLMIGEGATHQAAVIGTALFDQPEYEPKIQQRMNEVRERMRELAQEPGQPFIGALDRPEARLLNWEYMSENERQEFIELNSELQAFHKTVRAGINRSAADSMFMDWSKNVNQARKDFEEWNKIDADFRDSILGQSIHAVGQLGVYIPASLIPYVGPMAIESALYQEAVDDYRATVPESEQNPLDEARAGLSYAIPGMLIERSGLNVITSRLFQGARKGRLAVKDLLTRSAKAFPEGFVAEGATEAMQGQLLDFLATLQYDPERELMSEEAFRRRFLEFVVGGIAGGVGSAALQPVADVSRNRAGSNYYKAKSGGPMTKSEFAQAREFLTNDQVLARFKGNKDHAELFIDAINGDRGKQILYNALISPDTEIPGLQKMESLDRVTLYAEGTTRWFVDRQGSGAVAVHKIDVSTPHGKEAMQKWEARRSALEYAEATRTETIDRWEAEQISKEISGIESLPTVIEREDGWAVLDPGDQVVAKAETEEDARAQALLYINNTELRQRRAMVGEAITFLESVVDGSSTFEQVEGRGTLADYVNRNPTSFDAIVAFVRSYENDPTLTPTLADLQNYEINGFNIIQGQDQHIEDISFIFDNGAPDTVIEERSEGYFKRAIEAGEITEAEALEWKHAWEEINEKVEYADTMEGLREFFSDMVIGYIHSDGGIVADIQDSQLIQRLLPTWFQTWVNKVKAYYHYILRHAAAMVKMREAGELTENLETHIRRSMGLDSEYREMKAREREILETLQDVNQDPADELQKKLKGKIAHPDVLREAGEELASDVADIYDNLVREVTVRTRARPGDPNSPVVRSRRQKNYSRANAFFPRTGGATNLDQVRESLNEEGFDFETVDDMLQALDSSLRGDLVYPSFQINQEIETARARFDEIVRKPVEMNPFGRTIEEVEALLERGITFRDQAVDRVAHYLKTWDNYKPIFRYNLPTRRGFEDVDPRPAMEQGEFPFVAEQPPLTRREYLERATGIKSPRDLNRYIDAIERFNKGGEWDLKMPITAGRYDSFQIALVHKAPGFENRKNGNHYWTYTPDTFRQSTEMGLKADMETMRIPTYEIFRPPVPPEATNDRRMEQTMILADEFGFTAFEVDEGIDRPRSIFVIHPEGLQKLPSFQILGPTAIYFKEAKETGNTFKLFDGKERFEIDSSKARWNSDAMLPVEPNVFEAAMRSKRILIGATLDEMDAAGFDTGTVDPDTVNYDEWREVQRRFMDHLMTISNEKFRDYELLHDRNKTDFYNHQFAWDWFVENYMYSGDYYMQSNTTKNQAILKAVLNNDIEQLPARYEDNLKKILKLKFKAEGAYKGQSDPLPVSDVLHFPELIQNYPVLKRHYVVFSENMAWDYKGAFIPSSPPGVAANGLPYVTFLLNANHPAEDVLSSMLHELQHWIQYREGFARGSSTDRYEGSSEEKLNKYLSEHGEIEARAVQKRRLLTPAERRSRPVLDDMDVSKGLRVSFQLTIQDDPNSFYLKTSKVLTEKFQGLHATADQIKAVLNKSGIKQDELKWTNILNAVDEMADGKGRVALDDVYVYLKTRGRVHIGRLVYGIMGREDIDRAQNALDAANDELVMLKTRIETAWERLEDNERYQEARAALKAHNDTFDQITTVGTVTTMNVNHQSWKEERDRLENIMESELGFINQLHGEIADVEFRIDNLRKRLGHMELPSEVQYDQWFMRGEHKQYTEQIFTVERPLWMREKWIEEIEPVFAVRVPAYASKMTGLEGGSFHTREEAEEYRKIVIENYRYNWMRLPEEELAHEFTPEQLGEYMGEVKQHMPEIETFGSYVSPHFRDVTTTNYTGHMRTTLRPLEPSENQFFEELEEEGKVTFKERWGMFIEEVQSDLHQAARKRGYNMAIFGEPAPDDITVERQYNAEQIKGRQEHLRQQRKALLSNLQDMKGWLESDPDYTREKYLNEARILFSQLIEISDEMNDLIWMAYSNTDTLPIRPFKNDFGLQMFKRALLDAVENDLDWIGWTSGIVQADRYDLRHYVRDIYYNTVTMPETGEVRTNIQFLDLQGQRVLERELQTDDELRELMGDQLSREVIETRSMDRKTDDSSAFFNNYVPVNIHTDNTGTSFMYSPSGDIRSGGFSSIEILEYIRLQNNQILHRYRQEHGVADNADLPMSLFRPARLDEQMMMTSDGTQIRVFFAVNQDGLVLFGPTNSADRAGRRLETLNTAWNQSNKVGWARVPVTDETMGVGGEGMMKYYDQMFVKDVGKYMKQYGAKVERRKIKGHPDLAPEHQENWVIRLTDEIKDQIAEEGQPSFQVNQGPGDGGRPDKPPEDYGITPASEIAAEYGSRQAAIEAEEQREEEKNAAAEGRIPLTSYRGSVAYLGLPISSSIRDISLPVFARIRKYALDLNTDVQEFTDRTLPFRKAFKKLTRAEKSQVGLLLSNGDYDGARSVMGEKDTGLTELQKVFEDLRAMAKKAGYEVGFIEGYFPRWVIDVDGLLATWGEEVEGFVQEQLRLAEELHGVLDEATKITIVNNALRGIQTVQVKKQLSNFQERGIDELTAEQYEEFYAKPFDALDRYIKTVLEGIHNKEFFGAKTIMQTISTGETTEFGDEKVEWETKRIDIEKSVGAYLLPELEAGRINAREQRQLQRDLEAFFGFQLTPKAWAAFRSIGYITTMGSGITSTLTQVQDIAFAANEAGWIRAWTSYLAAMFKLSEVKIERDLGLGFLNNEYKDMISVARSVDAVFQATGLKHFGRAGQNTLVNSGIRKYRAMARRGKLPVRERERLNEYFGNNQLEINELMKELRSGEMTDRVRLLGWNILADYHPVDLTEMPQGYLNNPKARVFYMLKTFTIKQLDSYRREGILEMRRGLRDKDWRRFARGFKNLVKLLMALFMMGVPVDWLKDFLMDRNPNVSNIMIDNAYKLVGLSRYAQYYAREHGLRDAALITLAPPMPYFDYPYRDYQQAVKEDSQWSLDQAETWRVVPLIGSPYYWRYGGGQTKIRKREERERKKREREQAL
jgi:hypothetical protein